MTPDWNLNYDKVIVLIMIKKFKKWINIEYIFFYFAPIKMFKLKEITMYCGHITYTEIKVNKKAQRLERRKWKSTIVCSLNWIWDVIIFEVKLWQIRDIIIYENRTIEKEYYNRRKSSSMVRNHKKYG